jgi:hypothetical protein
MFEHGIKLHQLQDQLNEKSNTIEQLITQKLQELKATVMYRKELPPYMIPLGGGLYSLEIFRKELLSFLSLACLGV